MQTKEAGLCVARVSACRLFSTATTTSTCNRRRLRRKAITAVLYFPVNVHWPSSGPFCKAPSYGHTWLLLIVLAQRCTHSKRARNACESSDQRCKWRLCVSVRNWCPKSCQSAGRQPKPLEGLCLAGCSITLQDSPKNSLNRHRAGATHASSLSAPGRPCTCT